MSFRGYIGGLSKVVIMTFFALAPAASAELRGDVETLQYVLERIEANQDNVRTWKGTARVEGGQTRSDVAYARYAATVEFAVDRESDALLWKWDYETTSLSNGGPPVADQGPTFVNGLVLGDTFYRYNRISPSGEPEAFGMNIDDRAALRSGRESDYFNPMWLYQNGSERHSERLAFFLKNASEIVGWEVAVNGNIVSLEYQSETLINRYVYDLEQGASPIEYYSWSPKIEGKRSWHYEERDGVWVPIALSYITTVDRESGKEVTTRTIDMADYSINEPIDSRLFDVTSLGIGDGDRVYDARAGFTYTYGPSSGEEVIDELEDVFAVTEVQSTDSNNANAFPAATKVATSSPMSTVGTSVTAVAVIAAVTLALILGVWTLLRWRVKASR